jgi:hypothetical protein
MNEWSYSPTSQYAFMAYTGTTLHVTEKILLLIVTYDFANNTLFKFVSLILQFLYSFHSVSWCYHEIGTLQLPSPTPTAARIT